MTPLHHVSLVLLLVAAGCRRAEIADGVTDSTFVTAMVELRRVQSDGTLDSAGRAAARAKALQGKGLSTAQLEAAARALAHDPERAAALWRAIEQRVSEPPPAGPVAPAGDSAARRDR